MQRSILTNLLLWVGIPIILLLCICLAILIYILLWQRKSKKNKDSTYFTKIIHDLKTPIYAIDGFVLLISKSLDQPQKVDEYLNKISNVSHHMLALVKDVIDLSKIKDNQMEVNISIGNIKDIINQCVDQIEPQVFSRNIFFEKEINVFHEKILVDHLHLIQVLTNLLSNAIKYTEPKGKIIFSINEMKLSKETSTFIFKVKDTGYGMSDEFQKHLFEPFAQERAFAHTDVESSGLGLCIVKKLVEMMQGKIEVESKVNEGSCFTVTLNLDIVALIK